MVHPGSVDVVNGGVVLLVVGGCCPWGMQKDCLVQVAGGSFSSLRLCVTQRVHLFNECTIRMA